MPFWLGSGAGGARLAVVLDKFFESGPGIVAVDLVKGLRLAEMAR